MYGIKEGWSLNDAADLSLQMFKEGSKAFEAANFLSFDFVKKKVMDNKIANLGWVVEDLFNLPMQREKLII